MRRRVRVRGGLDRNAILHQQGATRAARIETAHGHVEFQPKRILFDDSNARRQPERLFRGLRIHCSKPGLVDDQSGTREEVGIVGQDAADDYDVGCTFSLA